MMKNNKTSIGCDCGQFSHQTPIEPMGIEGFSKKPLPKSKAPFWMIIWWSICLAIGSLWHKVFGKKDEDSGLTSFIFIGIIAATFVSCTPKSHPSSSYLVHPSPTSLENNVSEVNSVVNVNEKNYEYLSENKSLIRDEIPDVNPTSTRMGGRIDRFETPEDNLLVLYTTAIYSVPEDNYVWIFITKLKDNFEDREKPLYSQKISLKNLLKDYFYYIGNNSYVSYENDTIYFREIFSEKIYEIKYPGSNLTLSPIEFTGKSKKPIEKITKREEIKY